MSTCNRLDLESGPLPTQAKSRDHEIVRAQKNASLYSLIGDFGKS